MGATKQLVAAAALFLCFGPVNAQTTGKTVRHHTVPVEASPSDLTAAEAAIEQQNYGTAELDGRVVFGQPHQFEP